MFKQQEEAINRVKALRKGNITVFGEAGSKPLPCDDIPNWKGDESCKQCPDPCKDAEEDE